MPNTIAPRMSCLALLTTTAVVRQLATMMKMPRQLRMAIR